MTKPEVQLFDTERSAIVAGTSQPGDVFCATVGEKEVWGLAPSLAQFRDAVYRRLVVELRRLTVAERHAATGRALHEIASQPVK